MKPVRYILLLLCTVLFLVSGCQPKNAATTGQSADTGKGYAVVTDGAGRKVCPFLVIQYCQRAWLVLSLKGSRASPLLPFCVFPTG